MSSNSLLPNFLLEIGTHNSYCIDYFFYLYVTKSTNITTYKLSMGKSWMMEKVVKEMMELVWRWEGQKVGSLIWNHNFTQKKKNLKPQTPSFSDN